MKTPVAKKKKSIIFLAWLMPIVAIIISYGLLQEYYDKNGKQVTIYVDDIKGLNLRKSHVEYRGVKIGDLVGIEPDKENINRFKIDVTIYKNFDYMIKDGSKFWIVSPQVSIDKIDNIGAVLTGDYIETLPPSEDISKLKALKDKYIFTAEVQKPLQKGKTIELLSNDGAISNGAKVLYKGIVVGEIYSKELQKNSNINYGILIYNKYKELLTNSSLFFKNTPVDFKISATDLNLKVPPIKHFITGSISFINDHKLINKDKNYLYDSKEELYYNDDIYILKLSENQEFKYIYYNSEKVAKVVESKYNTKSDTKTLYIKFKDKYKYILQKSPSFYIQKSKLDIENIDIKGMITGDKLIVNIDSTKYTKPKKEYKAKVYNIKDIQKGKKIKIASDSISTGQKIYYKGIEIGYVSRVYLQDMQKISEVIIYKKYKNLINSSSMFYKINDINTKLSLDGLKVEVASIKQIFYGGISFETLDKSAKHSNKIYSLYDSYDDMRDDIESKKYFYITITAQDAYNIKSTSKLYYKNISIADVESIELNSDISIKLKVDNRYKSLFGSDSKIYLEGIRISLDKVKNLSSSVLGDKLHIVPSDGGFKDKYTLDAINPNETKYKDGLRVVLKHTNSKNISVDTPLYYNYYKIGKVESIALNTNTDDIEITLYIEPKYTKYITDASSFRLSKLIDVELGLVNSKVNIGTLKTLIDGGIDVISPKEYKALAKDGDVYHLSVEDEDSE